MLRYGVIHVFDENKAQECSMKNSWGYMSSSMDHTKAGFVPPLLFAPDKGLQDALYKDLMKKYPGHLFSKVDVVEVGQCPPSDPIEYTVSDKGVLPK